MTLVTGDGITVIDISQVAACAKILLSAIMPSVSWIFYFSGDPIITWQTFEMDSRAAYSNFTEVHVDHLGVLFCTDMIFMCTPKSSHLFL